MTFDPFDILFAMDEDDMDFDEGPGPSLDWLRSHQPREKTSTYRADSDQARLGAEAERIVRRELRRIIADRDLEVEVHFWRDARVRPLDFGPCPDLSAHEAIDNSKNGDLYVMRDGRIVRSVEVKSSLTYPNASISLSELTESSAEYLVALTTAGLWACTMDEARGLARKVDGPTGTFWIVPRDRVQTVELVEILR